MKSAAIAVKTDKVFPFYREEFQLDLFIHQKPASKVLLFEPIKWTDDEVEKLRIILFEESLDQLKDLNERYLTKDSAAISSAQKAVDLAKEHLSKVIDEDDMEVAQVNLLLATRKLQIALRRTEKRDEILSWVKSESNHPFSFNTCCKCSGLYPHLSREAILDYLHLN